MRVDNNKDTSKTVQEMQELFNRCLDFENKFGKTTRTTAWIKWCTDEKYRKRSIDFNQSIARTIRNMNPIKLNNVLNDDRYGKY